MKLLAFTLLQALSKDLPKLAQVHPPVGPFQCHPLAMNSTYITPGPPSNHGLISFKSWNSTSQETLQQRLDALLNINASKQVEDELSHSFWSPGGTHSKEPVPSLL